MSRSPTGVLHYWKIDRLPEACSVGTSHFVSDVNKRTLVRRFTQMTTIKFA